MHIGETLQTEGVAQARRGEHAAALETLRRAATAAEEAGDFEYSGQVFLTMRISGPMRTAIMITIRPQARVGIQIGRAHV